MTRPKDTLIAIRQTLGMTQGQFGDILGLSGQQVSAIEKGRSEPTKTLLKLAVHEFGADPEALGLGETPIERSLEERSRKAFSHLVLASCVTAPVAPILAGTVAAGVGVATIVMRMVEAYGTKTEGQLADQLNIQRGVLWRWKKKGGVPPKYLLKASKDTGKTVEWFISREGEKNNLNLLEETIVAFEQEIERLAVVLNNEEKAKTISYLYGEFQKEGAVDQEKITKVINLIS